MNKCPLTVEGENCWRKVKARRAALLLNGERYFRAFVDACKSAQHSIYITGWEIHSRIRLVRDGSETEYPIELRDFLNDLVERKPDLRIYILIWNHSMIFTHKRELFPWYHLGWRTHKRVKLLLDNHVPLGGSQHSKIVVVDDKVAFCGGLDLTWHRWDTSQHHLYDERRRDPKGRLYGPYHDVMLAVDGEAAHALGELVRDRWNKAGGGILEPPCQSEEDNWPSNIEADFENITIAIARTERSVSGKQTVREIEALYLDSIAAAQNYIYIENQYITSPLIAQALEARISEPGGPEVVMVSSYRSPSFLERTTLDILRTRLIKRLYSADKQYRLRALAPVIQHDSIQAHTLVHAKIFIADDCFLRIGSSNLTNRSMSLDIECDLAIECEGDPQKIERIRYLRDKIIAEHLGATVSHVSDTIAQKGSLVAGIDALRNDQGHTLMPIYDLPDPFFEAVLPEKTVIDPEEPISSDIILRSIIKELGRGEASIYRPFFLSGGLLVVLLLLIGIWSYTDISQFIDLSSISSILDPLQYGFTGFAAVVGTFILGGFLRIPVTMLMVLTALVFGPWRGSAYSFIGAMGSALILYALGRSMHKDIIRLLAGKYLSRLSKTMGRQTMSMIAALRVVPIAPFTLVNLISGAFRVNIFAYTLGSIIGMAPGILILSFFSDQARLAVQFPSLTNIIAPIAILFIFALIGEIIRRWLNESLELGRLRRKTEGY